MIIEFFRGFAIFLGYYVAAVLVLLGIRLGTKVPREVFRKMLHVVCACSLFVLLHAFDTWYLAALTAVLFAVLVYPLIWLVERFPRVMDMLVERSKGEIRFSLMLVFTMMAALITVYWGLLGPAWKFVIPVAVMGWGTGDAAAALVGKAVGKHQITHRLTRGTKTWEGSLAMFAVSAVAMFAMLLIYWHAAWPVCLLVALVAAVVAAAVEVISDGRYDTITVPLAASVLVSLLAALIGG